jgi:hypothetical protein
VFFIDASDLTILNTFGCCSGLFTRILSNQRSAIDYILMSKEMAQNVKSVFIDEEGKYDLHSDHAIISAELGLNNISINCNDPKWELVLKWKINDNSDWEAFQTYLKKAFGLSPLPVCNNVNTIWETWKNNIDNTANHIVGKH